MTTRSSVNWLAALATTLALLACRRPSEDGVALRAAYVKDLAFKNDAGASWALTANDEIRFDDGWYPVEHEPARDVRGPTWRWMGQRSLIKLRSHGAVPMRLRVKARAATDIVRTRPVITYAIDGQRIDSFVADGWFESDLVVPSAMLARATWVDFSIQTSATGKARPDPRELGVSLSDISWEPVPEAERAKNGL